MRALLQAGLPQYVAECMVGAELRKLGSLTTSTRRTNELPVLRSLTASRASTSDYSR